MCQSLSDWDPGAKHPEEKKRNEISTMQIGFSSFLPSLPVVDQGSYPEVSKARSLCLSASNIKPPTQSSLALLAFST